MPIVILILSVPIIVLGAMDAIKQKELDLAKSKLEEIKNEYGQISKIEYKFSIPDTISLVNNFLKPSITLLLL